MATTTATKKAKEQAKALRAENEIVIALYLALDNEDSMFNDELVSLETLNENEISILVA